MILSLIALLAAGLAATATTAEGQELFSILGFPLRNDELGLDFFQKLLFSEQVFGFAESVCSSPALPEALLVPFDYGHGELFILLELGNAPLCEIPPHGVF